MNETNKIVCGFAGIGKSYLAKNKEGYVDLESTPFNKDWNTYVNVAAHMQRSGYTVMMSCHKELREMLKERKLGYVVVIPKKEHKQAYIERYKGRGNNEDFIKLFEERFDSFIDEIKNTELNVIELENEYTTLADIVTSL